MRFILGELFDTWSWQPNDRKWFWLDGIESCCVRVEGSSKSICVRRFFPSPLFLFRFHFSPFPQKRLILRLGGNSNTPRHASCKWSRDKLWPFESLACVHLNLFFLHVTTVYRVSICCTHYYWFTCPCSQLFQRHLVHLFYR